MNDLTLCVTKNVAGVLETNISALEEFVKNKLEEYNPANYAGDADSAKKSRAELNNAKKELSAARIKLINELMKPYSDFETRCKNLERMIGDASGKLDEIVKIKEEEEKNRKKEIIKLMWEQRNFSLFPLDKVFNPKWLNKGYKEVEISADIDAVIERTYKDLKTIERYAEDAETLKAHYLISLDIGETLDYGEELQKKRELAKAEAENRSEREHKENVRAQTAEINAEYKSLTSVMESSDFAAQALGQQKQRKEYIIKVKCFEDELLFLKTEINKHGVEFTVQELNF